MTYQADISVYNACQQLPLFFLEEIVDYYEVLWNEQVQIVDSFQELFPVKSEKCDIFWKEISRARIFVTFVIQSATTLPTPAAPLNCKFH